MFEKAAKTMKSVGENVFTSAKSVGSSIYSTTKEQSELASLNVQKSVVEKKLNNAYAEIGKKYVAYVQSCEDSVVFDVTDIIESIQPELEKLEGIEDMIEIKKQEIKEANEEKLRKKAQSNFEFEKSKLDKALELDIIDEYEYEEKLAAAQKKLDNYDMLRKVDLQYEKGIITKAEYDAKIKSILS